MRLPQHIAHKGCLHPQNMTRARTVSTAFYNSRYAVWFHLSLYHPARDRCSICFDKATFGLSFLRSAAHN